MASVSRIFKVGSCILIVRVTAAIVSNYTDYLPPNFESDFLHGRRSYFFDGYQIPFYVHIASSPIALVVGLPLISRRFLKRWPCYHRTLGKLQVANVLLLVAPSGLWMAAYAEGGLIGKTAFATLALTTAVSAWVGWRLAVRRRFRQHQHWMMRCYLLLCSAVVLRIMGGMATIFEWHSGTSYQIASWISWLLPWACYEFYVGWLDRKPE